MFEVAARYSFAGTRFVSGDSSAGTFSFSLDVSFSAAAPWIVFYGPSGAGKSTLLRIVAGLISPSYGRIVLGDRVLFDSARKISIPARHRSIGFVAQRPSLFPHLSVRQNIAYGLGTGFRGNAAESAATVANLLTSFLCEEIAERRPDQISGGEQQAVALARALARSPHLLLLDEPFSAMDARTKEQVQENLAAWVKTHGATAILVSHDLADAFRFPAEVVVLDGGRVREQGAAEIVLAEERRRLLKKLAPSKLAPGKQPPASPESAAPLS